MIKINDVFDQAATLAGRFPELPAAKKLLDDIADARDELAAGREEVEELKREKAQLEHGVQEFLATARATDGTIPTNDAELLARIRRAREVIIDGEIIKSNTRSIK